MNLENFVVNPASLMLVVFGLVEFSKQLGARGRGLRLLSLGLGALLAVLYRVGLVYPAAQPWIETGFFGLAAGLAASGVYGFLDRRLGKLEDPAAERIEGTGAR